MNAEALATFLRDRGLEATHRRWYQVKIAGIPGCPPEVQISMYRMPKDYRDDPQDPFLGWTPKYRCGKTPPKEQKAKRRIAAQALWAELYRLGLIAEVPPDEPELVGLPNERL